MNALNGPARAALHAFYDWSPTNWQSVFPVANLAVVQVLMRHGLIDFVPRDPPRVRRNVLRLTDSGRDVARRLFGVSQRLNVARAEKAS